MRLRRLVAAELHAGVRAAVVGGAVYQGGDSGGALCDCAEPVGEVLGFPTDQHIHRPVTVGQVDQHRAVTVPVQVPVPPARTHPHRALSPGRPGDRAARGSREAASKGSLLCPSFWPAWIRTARPAPIRLPRPSRAVQGCDGHDVRSSPVPARRRCMRCSQTYAQKNRQPVNETTTAARRRGRSATRRP